MSMCYTTYAVVISCYRVYTTYEHGVTQLINLTLCEDYLYFLEDKELEVLDFVGAVIVLGLDFV